MSSSGSRADKLPKISFLRPLVLGVQGLIFGFWEKTSNQSTTPISHCSPSTPTSPSKLQAFAKAKCQIYRSTYACLNHLTYMSLNTVFLSCCFFMMLVKIQSKVSLTSFSYKCCRFAAQCCPVADHQELTAQLGSSFLSLPSLVVKSILHLSQNLNQT